MSHLVLCVSCRRHVRSGDELCPFCGVPLSTEQRTSAPPELPRRRMGRAALFTFGATLMGGVACAPPRPFSHLSERGSAAGCASSRSW